MIIVRVLLDDIRGFYVSFNNESESFSFDRVYIFKEGSKVFLRLLVTDVNKINRVNKVPTNWFREGNRYGFTTKVGTAPEVSVYTSSPVFNASNSEISITVEIPKECKGKKIVDLVTSFSSGGGASHWAPTEGASNSYVYTKYNFYDNLSIDILNSWFTTLSLKVNSNWIDGEEVYMKVDGIWKIVDQVFLKTDGAWQEAE